jgi:putative copper export protein
MVQGSVFVLMRWLHIGSAALIVGGLVLIVLSAGPMRTITRDAAIDGVIKRIESRFRLVVALAVAGLLISGVYQWVVFGQAYQDLGMGVLAVLGVKVLLAVAFFAMLWGFQVGSMVGESAKPWRVTNLTLAVLVLMLAGVVRYLRLGDIL